MFYAIVEVKKLYQKMVALRPSPSPLPEGEGTFGGDIGKMGKEPPEGGTPACNPAVTTAEKRLARDPRRRKLTLTGETLAGVRPSYFRQPRSAPRGSRTNIEVG